MGRTAFYLKTAAGHLLHGGQRIFVAILCVAFGVMSLVAMTSLSSSLERMLVQNPHDMIGADISMDRSAEDFILPEHIAALDELVQQGLLEKYTSLAYTSTLAFHLPDSGELNFISAGMGITADEYPPIGELVLEDADSPALSVLLSDLGDIMISRDLAMQYHLAAGDTIILSDLNSGAPVEAHIRGIIVDTPNHKGDKIYYSLATAQALAGSDRILNTVLATTQKPEKAEAALDSQGWRVYLAEKLASQEKATQDLFATMLNGAGVLGLLVSGVGIANTMQVLMRRRQRELAVWKSMGYQNGNLLVMFSLEAGLLGLMGAVVGAVLGYVLSAGLVNLFSRTSTMLIRWLPDTGTILLIMAIGVVTTVVFAMWSIVSSSRVSPVSLLRGERISADKMPVFQSLLLIGVLAVPFTALIGLIMGSTGKAILTLAAAMAGLVGLGGAFGALLWVIIRVLPRRGFPMLSMARSSLKQRGLAPVFALIALFIGVVAITLSTVVTQNAAKVIENVTMDLQGSNLSIVAPADQADEIAAALADQPVESSEPGYNTWVKSIRQSGQPDETFAPLLKARNDANGYVITGAPWGSQPDGVYLSSWVGIPEGTRLEITTWDGVVHKVTVAGSFQMDVENMVGYELGVLMPVELSQSITAPDQVEYAVRIQPKHLSAAARELGETLKQATVINLVAYAARFSNSYRNLFLFAVSMASLAFLAGMLLMANSVSLSVHDRRFEIGVLKAMGYSFKHILGSLMVEYALIALLAAGTGLVVVKLFLMIMSAQNEVMGSLMVLTPEAAAAVGLLCLGLTLASILAVAWKSVRVPAVVVLSDRE